MTWWHSATLTTKIVYAMLAGLVVGLAINLTYGVNGMVQPGVSGFSDFMVYGVFHTFGKMFVSALKMLVVPLVTFSLICGVLGIGDIRVLGRVGGKSVFFYLLTTAIAIATAIIIASVLNIGAGFEQGSVAVKEVTAKDAPSLADVLINIVPTNPIQAMANGSMLPIIFFAVLVGISMLMMGKEGKGLQDFAMKMNDLMMNMVKIVMSFAPYGVFFLIAKTFAENGPAMFMPLIGYVIALLGSLAFHCFVTLMLLLKLFSGLSPMTFLRKIRPAQTFAFSTASSNATIPATLSAVTNRVGVHPSVGSFTVPFGATINMDGTAIMQGVATVFIANVYGVELGVGGYLTVILMAVLASIGTAGVPGVGMVMLTMVLTQVGLPVEAVGMLLGVDRLMDMCRTAVNVTGDAVVSSIVAKGEGKLDMDIFNNPDAGIIMDSDLPHVDDEGHFVS
ncbi:dicarboxylate/amino acid:cation symporter [Lentibacter algarum]|uniref:dicarboxylate/amino acid:cation symporter n=1 Tax=Lentibacter algarum TaxID=576131 RepID=UPI001C06A6D9|nr:dicarboxylate/amino acid:cation symporter [Lentibacter algarum]MBU2981130.1 dicarboxylate/amino acid:cation symporter [Lentibacter algarum]